MASILRLHPDSACDAVSAITVEAARPDPGRLALVYAVTTAGDGLLVPPPAAPIRADGLWRDTCFEAFIRAPGAPAYLELNLAPSGQWAAYRFTDRREGMAPLDPLPAPAIRWRAAARGFELAAELDLSQVGLPPEAAWRLALSAVIEETGGRTSYWALAHPPGKADFHHPDGFALDLSPMIPGP